MAIAMIIATPVPIVYISKGGIVMVVAVAVGVDCGASWTPNSVCANEGSTI